MITNVKNVVTVCLTVSAAFQNISVYQANSPLIIETTMFMMSSALCLTNLPKQTYYFSLVRHCKHVQISATVICQHSRSSLRRCHLRGYEFPATGVLVCNLLK